MRLLFLHVRSRRAGWALACIGASVILTWLGLREVSEIGAQLRFAAIVLPLMPAVVIGGSAWSPFSEPEAVAGSRLPLLRVSHLGGLLLISGAGLLLVASGWSGAEIELVLARNLAGYTGLALIGARLLGAGIGWVAPLGYASLALVVDASTRLGWPQRIPVDRSSMAVAALLLVAGLGLVTLWGARLSPGEDG